MTMTTVEGDSTVALNQPHMTTNQRPRGCTSTLLTTSSMPQPETHLLLAGVLLVGLDVITDIGVAGLGEASRASLAA